MDLSNMSNEELLALHKKTKNLVTKYHNFQLTKKIILNSGYGAMSNRWFAFYSDDMAESITLSGQLSLKWIDRKLNLYFNKLLKTDNVDYVIYGDTDSIYVNVKPIVDAFCKGKTTDEIIKFLDDMCEKAIQPYIDKAYQELADMLNVYEQKMEMKRENIADRGIWMGKKKYILNVWDSEGVRYSEPHVKLTGVEAIRSNTPYICREYIKNSIDIIMKGTEGQLQDYIKECKKDFFSKGFEDIARPSGVNGMIEYSDKSSIYKKGTPMHVRAALVYNHHIKKNKLENKYPLINDGDKIKVCYMKVPNPLQENVFGISTILPKELDLEQFIDYPEQFQKTFIQPLELILKVIDWSSEKRVTLESIFTWD